MSALAWTMLLRHNGSSGSVLAAVDNPTSAWHGHITSRLKWTLMAVVGIPIRSWWPELQNVGLCWGVCRFAQVMDPNCSQAQQSAHVSGIRITHCTNKYTCYHMYISIATSVRFLLWFRCARGWT